MSLENRPLVVIVGPTAVGKTDLSIALAEQLEAEIINGDSLQVYRGLDIGTGKIKNEEMHGIPHHLLDILDPVQGYSASDFQRDSQACIEEIYQRGRLPILVGGTGLYIEGLLYGLDFGRPGSYQPEIRQALEDRARKIGPQALWKELDKKDPLASKKIPYQNVRRTIRALEVLETSGRRFSDQAQAGGKQLLFRAYIILLDRPRPILYERINQRVLAMQAEGLETEAYQLYQKDPHLSFQASKGIGYKEWWPYFQGNASLEETLAKIQQNSRRYAKRQLTWFRNRLSPKDHLILNEAEDPLDQTLKSIKAYFATKEELSD